MTVEQYAQLHGKRTDAVQVNLRRKFRGEKFALNTELTAEHLAALSVDRRKSGKQPEAKPAKVRAKIARKLLEETPVEVREKVSNMYDGGMWVYTKTVEEVKPEEMQPEPVTEAASGPEEKQEEQPKERLTIESIRSGLLSAILLAVIIGHGALIWYDCSTLWGTAGLIGGGVVFLIVLAAVLLASDETRVRTSGTALYFALCIDISAWWVHFPTFQRPDVSDVITGALCAFLCACSWIALFLYRDKNLD